MKFSWNVDCFRLLFPSPFVDFLNKYKYLSVKNNWTRYLAKIIRFLLSHAFFYTRNRPKIHFIRGFALGKSFSQSKVLGTLCIWKDVVWSQRYLFVLNYLAKSFGNGNWGQSILREYIKYSILSIFIFMDRAVLRLTDYRKRLHCLRN